MDLSGLISGVVLSLSAQYPPVSPETPLPQRRVNLASEIALFNDRKEYDSLLEALSLPTGKEPDAYRNKTKIAYLNRWNNTSQRYGGR